jgi:hypothetical protein
MSGLIFVQDAEGRPLMPMSAAYARTLIKQGKAQVWPHPAFSVIQLTRVVEMPILRPVLVGISLTSTIADLVITVDQQRSRPSTIHIVVDFQSLPLLRKMHPNRLVPHRRSIPFVQIGSLPATMLSRSVISSSFHRRDELPSRRHMLGGLNIALLNALVASQDQLRLCISTRACLGNHHVPLRATSLSR